jgi:hypothetical protein
VTAPETTIAIPVADDASIGLELVAIPDDYMRARLGAAQSYTVVILRKTPRYKRPEADPVVWEHGRRNMALQQSGLMPIVCPARDDSDLAGICILSVSPARAAEILSEDPGVKAGIFTFDVHPVAGFLGSSLAAEGHPEGQSQTSPGASGFSA